MLISLYSGVSGLRAHQEKMNVISNNIANVNTYGFKSSSAAFQDVYYRAMTNATAGTNGSGGVNPSQVGYGTQLGAISKNMGRAGFESTSNGLDLGIAGEGFFQVMDQSGNVFYTRAGNFHVDNNGYLVDGNGNFVLGVTGDPTSRNPASNPIQLIVPPLVDSVASYSLDELEDADGDPYAMKVTTANIGEDSNIAITFVLDSTLTRATSKAEYDPTSGRLLVTIGTSDVAAPATASDLTDAIDTAVTNSATATAGLPTGAITVDWDLDPDGDGTDAGAVTGTEATAIQTILDSTIRLTGGSTAGSQSVSDLTSLAIGNDGVITASHPVHGTMLLGRVDLATFDNPNGLDQVGNSYFAANGASGAANLANAGLDGSGEIQTGALEMSNVDLAQEFANMITTQRGYQANSRIITTSDQILEELVNLKR